MNATTGVQSDAYDLLAPHFREIVNRRRAYIQAVDNLIIRNTSIQSPSILDVGAGDGIRGAELARALGARRLVQADPSHEMADLCRKGGADLVVEKAAESLDLGESFDVIVCLWNVLGHVSDSATRLKALENMRKSLAPGGRIFLDVNSRHNANNYGRLRVFFRRIVDFIAPAEHRGDAQVNWSVNGETISGKGHLFTCREMLALLRGSGLALIDFKTVDYLSGTVSTSSTAGQMFFILGAR